MDEQQLMFEASAKDLIERALAMPLERKIEKAVAVLREYEKKALELSPDGYYVCDSGGKDSDCIVELARMAGVKHTCNHNLTTIDPPELYRYLRKTRPDTIIHRPKMHMMTRLIEKGTPPTRRIRWCCEEYKEHGGDGLAKVIGVRISESARRAEIWQIVNINKKIGWIIAPIAYWTDYDVWEFHKMRNLPYCELYDQGFKRLGCIGCPMAGSTGQAQEFARWPRYELMWRKAVFATWHKWRGIPNKTGTKRLSDVLGSPESYYAWWRSGEAQESPDQCVFEEMMSNT